MIDIFDADEDFAVVTSHVLAESAGDVLVSNSIGGIDLARHG